MSVQKGDSSGGGEQSNREGSPGERESGSYRLIERRRRGGENRDQRHNTAERLSLSASSWISHSCQAAADEVDGLAQ